MVKKEVVENKLSQLNEIEKAILQFIIEEDRPLSRKEIYIFMYETLGYLKEDQDFLTKYAEHFGNIKNAGLISVEQLSGNKEVWEVPSPRTSVNFSPEKIDVQHSYRDMLKKLFLKTKDLCFVLMPFGRMDAIWKKISEIKVAGIEIKRADNILKPGIIIDQIFDSIENARIIVADCTDLNPNVMYELGYAHAKGKDTIITTQNDPMLLPFDIKHYRVIQYAYFPAINIKSKLTQAIIEAIKG